MLFAVAALVGACGQEGASLTTPAPSHPATASHAAAASHGATEGPRQTASAAPTPGSPGGPAASPSVNASCPGAVEVVRSLGTPATDNSTNWAGYAVSTKSQPFTCVEATWTQPSVVCRGTSLAAVAFWVGLGGVGQVGLVQTGTQIQCDQGSATASAWHQSLPQEPYAVNADLAVSVGDRVRARVLALGRSSYSVSIENLTTGVGFALTSANRTVDPTTAEWITEAPTVGCPTKCAVASLPDFGTVAFSDVSTTVGGVNVPLNAAGFARTRTTLVTTSGLPRAIVSATGGNGRSFQVTWVRP